jgi:hypothetical protein
MYQSSFKRDVVLVLVLVLPTITVVIGVLVLRLYLGPLLLKLTLTVAAKLMRRIPTALLVLIGAPKPLKVAPSVAV